MPGVLAFLRSSWDSLRAARKVRRWHNAGRPVPPPSAVKRLVLRAYAQHFRSAVFVETGTHRGDTVAAVRPLVARVDTIEIEPAKVAAAKRRFAGDHAIRILEGDSGKLLPKVLADLTQPALFWLDGHFMGTGSGDPEHHTPISVELDAVLDHPVRNHVILIDDARLFDGTNDYPRLDDLRNAVARKRPDLHWLVRHDSIRITPTPFDHDLPA
jgi:hypothetical protein